MSKKLTSALFVAMLSIAFSNGCIEEIFEAGNVEIIVNNIDRTLDKVVINLTFINNYKETIKINYTDFRLYDTEKLSFRCRGPRNLPKVDKGCNATFEIYFDIIMSKGRFTKLKYISKVLDKSVEVDLLKRGIKIIVHDKVEIVPDCYINITFENYCGRAVRLDNKDFKVVDENNFNFTCYGPKDLGEILNGKNSTFVLYFDIREKKGKILYLVYDSGYVDKPEIVNIGNI